MIVLRTEVGTSELLEGEVALPAGARVLMNVGSVGQPRDRNPKSAYVIYDLDEQTITMRRVDYDMETTQRKIRAAGLPFRNALRLESGR